MASYANADIFADPALAENPHPYYEYLRSQGSVVRLPQHGVVATVDYDETLSVFRDDDRFSAVVSVNGPFPGLPFTPEGDDITAQIEQYRSQMPSAGLIATQDPPHHTRTRALMAGIITPRRLRENEEFMWKLADQQIDEFVGSGRFEVRRNFALPFATLTIADLLGVPESDHGLFTELFGQVVMPGKHGKEEVRQNPLEGIGKIFHRYLSERRETPHGDVLTDLAQARYPDGSLPEIRDLLGIAAFLFVAGQDTTVSLITASLRIMTERPELQNRLRHERALIPNFLEEVLRLEPTVKAVFRLSKVPVKVGELDLPAGTIVMLNIAAANRDPKRFENPNEFQFDRKNARENLAFGRGIHACIGSPLARAEAKVALERIFDRIGEFRIDESLHDPKDPRRFRYAPSFMFRVLNRLQLDFEPL